MDRNSDEKMKKKMHTGKLFQCHMAASCTLYTNYHLQAAEQEP